MAGKALSSQMGFAIIKAYAFQTPHKHLYDPDGTLYMGRWHVVDEGTIGGKLLEFFTGYSSCRLHYINREDDDRDLHNHPFEYRTFVLKGFYSEEYLEPGYTGHLTESGKRWIHRGGTGTGSQFKRHRIDLISKGGVWTLFFMTRNTGRWGFFVNNKFVESTRYFIRNRYPRETIRAVQSNDKA
jgi:hypothetical protein